MARNLLTGFALILSLAGCGGGLGGAPVAVPPERFQAIRPQAADRPAMVFPGSDGFAIHDKSSQQNPGQDGSASSAADAKPEGTAFCIAAAGLGGSAGSSFVLGAALHNDSDGALPVAVTCDIEYEYALEATVGTGRDRTGGKIAFVLEAREQGTGKLLFQHPLASLSGYEDNVRRSDQQRLQFAATVSPAARWRIVLQGQVSAQASAEGQAQAQLRVTRCEMTVRPMAAPATQLAR